MLTYESAIQAKFEVVEQHGDEFVCLCPEHGDTRSGRPNLYANGDSGLWYCHVCEYSGKLGENPNISLKEARAMLGRFLDGVNAPKDAGPEIWEESRLSAYKNKCDFWDQRGITPEIVERFNLGYAPMHNQAVIPFRDHQGNLIGVIRRNLGKDVKPKYLNPKGLSLGRYLFGADQLTDTSRVALCEGPMDALAYWSVGRPALALSGARMTKHQYDLIRTLGIKTVVISLDNDRVGQIASEAFAEKATEVRTTAVAYPNQKVKDPGELLLAVNGRKRLSRIFDLA